MSKCDSILAKSEIKMEWNIWHHEEIWQFPVPHDRVDEESTDCLYAPSDDPIHYNPLIQWFDKELQIIHKFES